MSNVIIVGNKVTLKGPVDRAFLETMFFLRIIYSGCLSLLDYLEGMVEVGIGLLNIQGNLLLLGNSEGPLTDPYAKSNSVFSAIVEETPSQSN